MTRIASAEVLPLVAEMNRPFEIVGGAKTQMRNVFVRARLSDGAIGLGEGAASIASGRSLDDLLRLTRRGADKIAGLPVDSWRLAAERLEDEIGGRPGHGPARAAIEMALLDAWAKRARVPLRALFGGREDRVASDVTVTLVPAAQAAAQAKKIAAFGVRTIKIKVGADLDDDFERVLAVVKAAPGSRIFLDANQGYTPAQAVRLAKKLKAKRIFPVLYEQPAARGDWDGLAEVHAKTKIPVAADESITSRAEAAEAVRRKCAQIVNIKLMKCGLVEALDIALICRAAGMGLMIGGMVESSLAMSCAAHFAAGLGGFRVVDLDTPLWLARDPFKGTTIRRGGIYDLKPVKAGIGVRPDRSPD